MSDRDNQQTLVELPQLQWSVLRLSWQVMPAYLQGADPSHSWWSLYIAEQPGLLVEHAGGRHRIGPHRLSFIPPWLPFVYRFPPELLHGFVHFAVADLPGVLVRRLFPQPVGIDDPLLLAEMQALMEPLRAGSSVDAGLAGLRASRLVAGALVRLLETVDPADRPLLYDPADHWGRLGPALRHVRQHLHRPIAVADLAAELGVNEKQCTRLFRRHLGQSPMQYCSEQRLQRAAELLLGTDWSLTVIATACGFANAQYLSRQFRRQHGLPPPRWRER
ncbi:MAG: helix-turn-helix domain-containing protein, partial [Planctomycetota bacterium]